MRKKFGEDDIAVGDFVIIWGVSGPGALLVKEVNSPAWPDGITCETDWGYSHNTFKNLSLIHI